jgi:hypothetical protein
MKKKWKTVTNISKLKQLTKGKLMDNILDMSEKLKEQTEITKNFIHGMIDKQIPDAKPQAIGTVSQANISDPILATIRLKLIKKMMSANQEQKIDYMMGLEMLCRIMENEMKKFTPNEIAVRKEILKCREDLQKKITIHFENLSTEYVQIIELFIAQCDKEINMDIFRLMIAAIRIKPIIPTNPIVEQMWPEAFKYCGFKQIDFSDLMPAKMVGAQGTITKKEG